MAGYPREALIRSGWPLQWETREQGKPRASCARPFPGGHLGGGGRVAPGACRHDVPGSSGASGSRRTRRIAVAEATAR